MKKEISTVLPLAVLGAAFLVVSALVVLTRGNPWLINKKLRLGALIIGINAVALGTGGCVTCYDSIVECYDSPQGDSMCLLDDTGACHGRAIGIPVDEVSTLEGLLSHRTSTEYSFEVVDDDGEALITGDIEFLDGASDQHGDAFEITLDGALLGAGSFQLRFHIGTAAQVAEGTGRVVAIYDLVVE